MLIKLSVFLLAFALVWVIIATVRLHLKNGSLTWFNRNARNGNESVSDTGEELSIAYLEGLLQRLEPQLKIVSHDFLLMKLDRQQKAIPRIKEIKDKISVVKEVIDQINDKERNVSKPAINNSSYSKGSSKGSITSFAIKRPSNSNWLYATSSHNGIYRTVHFGNSSNDTAHNPLFR